MFYISYIEKWATSKAQEQPKTTAIAGELYSFDLHCLVLHIVGFPPYLQPAANREHSTWHHGPALQRGKQGT